MKFCNKCDNMYYIRVSDDDGNSLTYYCRNCGNEETNIQDNICVSKTNLKRKEDNYMRSGKGLSKRNSISACPDPFPKMF